MIAALSILLPLGAAGAVSPVMLTEQIIVLGGQGRRAAWRYALGATLTLFVIVVLLVFLGSVIKLPAKPTLSASLDIVLGGALVAFGASIAYLGRHPVHRHKSPKRGGGDPSDLARSHASAFPFGVFSMATNFTTIAIVTVAAKVIAGANTNIAGRMFLIAFLVAACSSPAWAPPLTTKLAPRSGRRVLETLSRLISDHGRQAVVVLLIVGGLYLLARGIFDVPI